ncbi:MAG: hypothetical protein Q4F71_00325, partial [Paracoccus sp. (in: a-proteobacteria)]|nr:hypothetical protein [Paracoccus sp. (in: a-proteobacteria)]
PKAAQTRLAKLGKAQEAPDPGALGYHMGAETGYDAALVALARGAALPGDWERDIAKGAGSPLPVSAGDLGGIAPGPAIGAGLRAAERLWLASGFAASRGDLIAAAQDAAKEAER